MLYQIAEKLATELQSGLAFADKVTGLIKVGSKDNRRIPIAYNMNPVTGDSDHYTDLVPDDTKTSIIYFMDQGSVEEAAHNNFTDFQGSMKLVCWINYTRVNAMIGETLHDDTYLVAEVKKILPTLFRGYKCIAFCLTSVVGQDPKDGAVFNAFTYDEQEQQYFTYPYDYFSLNLELKYRVVNDCVDFTVL